MDPVVSIVIPTYNRAEFVAQAITSCVGQLPGPDCQIIVVDDSSSDQTADVVRHLNSDVKYVTTASRSGQADARNLGFAQAAGKWIKFLDSDDVLEPGALAEEVRTGNRSSAEIVVSGWGEVEINANGTELESSRRTYGPPVMSPSIVDAVLAGRAVPTSAALYRRDVVGDRLWDKGSGKLDDWDWFCQMALRASKIAAVPGLAYWMRNHTGDRVSARRPMIENARCHHHILRRIESFLTETGQLTPARRRRLAQYYYKELRVFCLYDELGFEEAVLHIRELDPEFTPRDEERQVFMQIASSVLGFRRATRWHSAVKRVIGRA